MRGHAIECRVYAEDPDNNFLPSPGTITRLRVPQGPGVRDDGGVYEGAEVSIYYDPMISKFCVVGANRTEAIERMRRALSEYEVGGIKTTLPFFRQIIDDPEFIEGKRFAFIRGHPKIAASKYRFSQHGASGHEISELLPHLSKVADEIAIVKSLHTDEFNHGPAQMFLHTGFGRPGRPSFGSWVGLIMKRFGGQVALKGVYYVNKETQVFGVRPEAGVGFPKAQLSYGYNFYTEKPEIPLPTHTVTLYVYFAFYSNRTDLF
jgi:hypothetical protein